MTEFVFAANNRLIKKIDGCPMGGPIFVVLSDIYVCKMEEDIVAPSNLFSVSVIWMILMPGEKLMEMMNFSMH